MNSASLCNLVRSDPARVTFFGLRRSLLWRAQHLRLLPVFRRLWAVPVLHRPSYRRHLLDQFVGWDCDSMQTRQDLSHCCSQAGPDTDWELKTKRKEGAFGMRRNKGGTPDSLALKRHQTTGDENLSIETFLLLPQASAVRQQDHETAITGEAPHHKVKRGEEPT